MIAQKINEFGMSELLPLFNGGIVPQFYDEKRPENIQTRYDEFYDYAVYILVKDQDIEHLKILIDWSEQSEPSTRDCSLVMAFIHDNPELIEILWDLVGPFDEEHASQCMNQLRQNAKNKQYNILERIAMDDNFFEHIFLIIWTYIDDIDLLEFLKELLDFYPALQQRIDYYEHGVKCRACRNVFDKQKKCSPITNVCISCYADSKICTECGDILDKKQELFSSRCEECYCDIIYDNELMSYLITR